MYPHEPPQPWQPPQQAQPWQPAQQGQPAPPWQPPGPPAQPAQPGYPPPAGHPGQPAPPGYPAAPAGQPPPPGYPAAPAGQPAPPGYPAPAGQPGWPAPTPAPAPASGLPVSPGYPTGYPPPPSAPPAPRGRGGLIALSIVNGVLVVALVVAGGVGYAMADGLRRDIAGLEQERARRQQATAAEQAKLRDDFQKADLPGKLERVRDLSAAAVQALLTWGRADSQLRNDTIKDVRAAADKCMEAVVEYDTTAARFPPQMLTDLPVRIDLNDDAMNCAR